MTTNISISLVEGKMKISNVGEQSLNKVIDGFFKALNVEHHVDVTNNVSDEVRGSLFDKEAKKQALEVLKKENHKAYANAHDPKVANEIAGVFVKKVADLVGDNKNMVHNPFKKILGEMKEENPLQKHIDRDDVRMVDDIPTYKTEFICPSCETTGKRYIRVDNKYTKCYNCQEKLVVEKVFSDSNEPDNNGYFFFAENIYKGDK